MYNKKYLLGHGMSKTIRLVILFLGLIISSTLSHAHAWGAHYYSKAPPYAAIVMDANTGKILYEENADAKVHPASLTKMMTLFLLFESLERKKIKLTTPMKISKTAVNQMPSKLGLKAGRTIKVKDAMLAMITKSANDATFVLAERLGGSSERFVQVMNAKARALGMKSTIFKNPSGLPNQYQITSARDMAILSRSLYKRFPHYYQYFKTRNFVYNGKLHKNHNHLLGKVSGVDGIKTGYVSASGFNLAASAKRKDIRLIAVVMGEKTGIARDKKMAELLNKGFNKAFLAQNKTKKKSNKHLS
jgi:D-alanyl-D-alanine carboxypeptidase